MPLYQDYTRAISEIEAAPQSVMAVKQPARNKALAGYAAGEGQALASGIKTETALQQSAFDNQMAKRGLQHGIRDANLGTATAVLGIGVEAYQQKMRLLRDLREETRHKEYMSKIDFLHNMMLGDKQLMYEESLKQKQQIEAMRNNLPATPGFTPTVPPTSPVGLVY